MDALPTVDGVNDELSIASQKEQVETGSTLPERISSEDGHLSKELVCESPGNCENASKKMLSQDKAGSDTKERNPEIGRVVTNVLFNYKDQTLIKTDASNTDNILCSLFNVDNIFSIQNSSKDENNDGVMNDSLSMVSESDVDSRSLSQDAIIQGDSSSVSSSGKKKRKKDARKKKVMCRSEEK